MDSQVGVWTEQKQESRTKRQGRGFRVVERDLEIIRWIGRARIAESGQAAAAFGMHPANMRRRLAGLRKRGYLEIEGMVRERPSVYIATREGHQAADLELPVMRPSLGGYWHTIEATSLLVELEREFGRDLVLTEREIRAIERPGDPIYAIKMAGYGPGQRLHYPDLIVLDQDERHRPLAIELERTVKKAARLQAIIRAYVDAWHLAGVRYYASTQSYNPIGAAIEATAAADVVELIAPEGDPSCSAVMSDTTGTLS